MDQRIEVVDQRIEVVDQGVSCKEQEMVHCSVVGHWGAGLSADMVPCLEVEVVCRAILEVLQVEGEVCPQIPVSLLEACELEEHHRLYC